MSMNMNMNMKMNMNMNMNVDMFERNKFDIRLFRYRIRPISEYVDLNGDMGMRDLGSDEIFSDVILKFLR